MFGKNLEVTPTESLFLLVLYNHPDLSGKDIVDTVKSDLGDDWSPTPGATYKIIQKLLDKGFINDTTKTDVEDRDQRIKTYSLTDKGNSMVVKVITRMEKVAGFLESCCSDADVGKIIIIKKSGSEDS